ncbi:MAG: N-acetyltransferase [Prevotellaceae bacterium]|nr:GNAT family N-acetyltransferase [Prevotella sp.]MCI7786574.1 GNAT family N-acetyltransferase [Prevotella sp.]MDD5876376.1 N-acetyltransferase [Prevotellaceae bacterium]MDD7421026.1 N-acetyltransferase [Prevotellaceae bacterium]MDY5946688.1 N-acetyltransferase [Prevotella sp.]
MKIIEASKEHAPEIARLVMMAMTDECCLNLAGEGNTLDDFSRVMNRLTAAEHSQYSYRNAILAVNDDGQVAGAIVSYDGAQLHSLRDAFYKAAEEELHVDRRGMDDETTAGEWYLDSLAVFPEFRGHGLAHLLLQAAISRGADNGLPATLLVDKGNPRAERLYRSVGFEYVEDATWGGHSMRRLRFITHCR